MPTPTDPKPVLTRINGRWPLLLPPHRAARPEWPHWEAARLADMHDRIQPGWLIADIGAEEGDLPALWATWGARVYLVEPNPRVWPNIRYIWEANRLPEPAGWWVGFASDRTVRRPPNAPADDRYAWVGDLLSGWPRCAHGQPDSRSGWPRCAHGPLIADHGFAHLSQQADAIPQIRLDDALEYVDAITIDVEGSELAVLRGATRLLDDARPLVWVSVHTDVAWMAEQYPGETREAVIAFMADHGYDGTFLARDHEEHWSFTPT